MIIVDRENRRGCSLRILRKGLGSYSLPIMLLPRKLADVPCIVTELRHLNSRLVHFNCTFPLVRDVIQILGTSKFELISIIDFERYISYFEIG